MSSKNSSIYKLVLSAMFLAIALLLPLLTGQIQSIGSMLCPMHIPVILCGFFCGPLWGCVVGLVAPILRFFLFGMPPLMPTGVAMCFELAVYGLVSGLLYRLFPKKKVFVYVSLVIAMIAGRIVWGLVRLFLQMFDYSFSWKMFLSGAVLTAVPGIILQIVLIPVLVIALRRFIADDKVQQ